MLVDKTEKDIAKERIEAICDNIEYLVKNNGLMYRYVAIGCSAGIAVSVTGEMRVTKKPNVLARFWNKVDGEFPTFGDDVLEVDLKKNAVTLFDEQYRSLAENIRGLLADKKRLQESKVSGKA